MPRIGLLSDSHGDAEMTRAAVALLVQQGVDRLIHLGDVGTIEVLDALLVAGMDETMVQSHVVFGNTDWNAGELERYGADLGLQVGHPMGRLDVQSATLAFCHGHDPGLMQQALRERVAYLCHGHTHVKCDERQGPTRVINPGALHRAAVYTVAVLDTVADRVRFHEVERV